VWAADADADAGRKRSRRLEDDVLRLEVEVDDLALVDEIDALEDLDGEVSALGLRQDVVWRRDPLEELTPGQELGQDDRLLVTLEVVEEPDDVVVLLLLQLGQDVDLTPDLLVVLILVAPFLVLGCSELLGRLAPQQVDLSESSGAKTFYHLESFDVQFQLKIFSKFIRF